MCVPFEFDVLRGAARRRERYDSYERDLGGVQCAAGSANHGAKHGRRRRRHDRGGVFRGRFAERAVSPRVESECPATSKPTRSPAVQPSYSPSDIVNSPLRIGLENHAALLGQLVTHGSAILLTVVVVLFGRAVLKKELYLSSGNNEEPGMTTSATPTSAHEDVSTTQQYFKQDTRLSPFCRTDTTALTLRDSAALYPSTALPSETVDVGALVHPRAAAVTVSASPSTTVVSEKPRRRDSTTVSPRMRSNSWMMEDLDNSSGGGMTSLPTPPPLPHHAALASTENANDAMSQPSQQLAADGAEVKDHHGAQVKECVAHNPVTLRTPRWFSDRTEAALYVTRSPDILVRFTNLFFVGVSSEACAMLFLGVQGGFIDFVVLAVFALSCQATYIAAVAMWSRRRRPLFRALESTYADLLSRVEFIDPATITAAENGTAQPPPSAHPLFCVFSNRMASTLLLPSSFYDTESVANRCLGELFVNYKSSWVALFLSSRLVVSFVTSFLLKVRLSFILDCRAVLGTVAVVFVFQALMYLIIRPFRYPLSNLLGATAALLTGLLAASRAFAFGDRGVMVTVLIVVVLVDVAMRGVVLLLEVMFRRWFKTVAVFLQIKR